MTKSQRQEFEQEFEDMVLEKVPSLRTKLEQRMHEGYETGFTEGFWEGMQIARVTDTLRLLGDRGIKLKPEDAAVLKGLDYAELPNISVAGDVADADDFVRRARLR